MIPIHILYAHRLCSFFPVLRLCPPTCYRVRQAKFGPLLASSIHVTDQDLCKVLILQSWLGSHKTATRNLPFLGQ